MAKPLLPDDLWNLLEPLFPAESAPGPQGGRPRISSRQALTGILFVLKTGIPWEDLPAEMNCGSGMTCWRRLRDWQLDGTWEKVHGVMLSQLEEDALKSQLVELEQEIAEYEKLRDGGHAIVEVGSFDELVHDTVG